VSSKNPLDEFPLVEGIEEQRVLSDPRSRSEERRRLGPQRLQTRDEFSFRERVYSDARLAVLVNILERELHEGNISAEDLGRCAVLAAQRYAERSGAPYVILFEKVERR
jgi:hypothetical protein